MLCCGTTQFFYNIYKKYLGDINSVFKEKTKFETQVINLIGLINLINLIIYIFLKAVNDK
jgi:hypothetical protein